MSDPKQEVERIIREIENGQTDIWKGWSELKNLKDEYVNNLVKHHPKIKSAEQSWHAVVGGKFERLVKGLQYNPTLTKSKRKMRALKD